jgi:hypothetical protein
LRAEGARQLNLAMNGRAKKIGDISHIVCWIGDVVFLYVEAMQKKTEIKVNVKFPELMNLHCISHPEIKKAEDWNSYMFRDNFLIIFEKIDLTA